MIRRYKKQMSDQTIWAHKSWQPYVIGRGKDLIYIFHIESGAIGLAFEAPITKEDILVIKRNPKRRLNLYAALHDPFQLIKNHLTEEEVGWYFNCILHSKEDELESFINLIDEPKTSRVRYLANKFYEEAISVEYTK